MPLLNQRVGGLFAMCWYSCWITNRRIKVMWIQKVLNGDRMVGSVCVLLCAPTWLFSFIWRNLATLTKWQGVSIYPIFFACAFKVLELLGLPLGKEHIVLFFPIKCQKPCPTYEKLAEVHPVVHGMGKVALYLSSESVWAEEQFMTYGKIAHRSFGVSLRWQAWKFCCCNSWNVGLKGI